MATGLNLEWTLYSLNHCDKDLSVLVGALEHKLRELGHWPHSTKPAKKKQKGAAAGASLNMRNLYNYVDSVQKHDAADIANLKKMHATATARQG